MKVEGSCLKILGVGRCFNVWGLASWGLLADAIFRIAIVMFDLLLLVKIITTTMFFLGRFRCKTALACSRWQLKFLQWLQQHVSQTFPDILIRADGAQRLPDISLSNAARVKRFHFSQHACGCEDMWGSCHSCSCDAYFYFSRWTDREETDSLPGLAKCDADSFTRIKEWSLTIFFGAKSWLFVARQYMPFVAKYVSRG